MGNLDLVDFFLVGNDAANLWSHFSQSLKLSPMPEEQKAPMAGSLYDAIVDRDNRMADVIEMYYYKMNLVKGIYYAGSGHIRKDLGKKDYGRRFFSASGILARKYPGRVCCLTFHMQPKYWQNTTDFNYLENLYNKFGRSFAVDSNDSRVCHLKLKSSIDQDGVALPDIFDGYIMLNQDKDYHPCSFVPGFYDDEFAKIIWDKLKKEGSLEHLPPEYNQWKEKTPTGEELMKMIKDGLH